MGWDGIKREKKPSSISTESEECNVAMPLSKCRSLVEEGTNY